MAQRERIERKASGQPVGKGRRRTDWQATFLEEVEKNVVIGLACKAAGVSESTFKRERGRNEKFALAYHDAHERGLDALEAILRLRATRGQPYRQETTRVKKDKKGDIIETIVTETKGLLIDTTAAIFLLKRYRPEFRESFRVENTGPDGGPIEIAASKVVGAKARLFAELDRIGADDD
jgi:hypothetical protein